MPDTGSDGEVGLKISIFGLGIQCLGLAGPGLSLVSSGFVDIPMNTYVPIIPVTASLHCLCILVAVAESEEKWGSNFLLDSVKKKAAD